MDEDVRYFLANGQNADFPIKTGPWMRVTVRGFGNHERSHRLRLRLDPGHDIKYNVRPFPEM